MAITAQFAADAVSAAIVIAIFRITLGSPANAPRSSWRYYAHEV
jgi:hypothetical protein